MLLQNYKQLSKAKLSALVVLTGAAGFVAGSEESIDWEKLAWTSLGTFGAAACANTLNQVYEVVNDSLMKRTMNRPLPAGRMGKIHALAFAAVTGAAGLGILATHTNGLTTSLAAANIALYAAAYTPLKQITIANTWVGAIVGAIPPLMGWASATGTLEPGALVLATALFSWQMPHFMALAYLNREDYARAGYRMMSMFDPLGKRTAGVALRHSLLLLPLGLAAAAMGLTTAPFAAEAAAMAGVMAVYSIKFRMQPSSAAARVLFRSSLLYLPLLMVAMAAHRLPNDHSISWAWLQQRLLGEQQQREEEEVWAGVVVRPVPRLYELWSGLLSSSRDVLGVSATIKCPSRVYGEVDEGVLEQQQQQEEEEQVEAEQKLVPQQQQ